MGEVGRPWLVLGAHDDAATTTTRLSAGTPHATVVSPAVLEVTYMKTLLAALALTLSVTGCIVRVPGPVRVETHERGAEKRCPPGHEWSDGRCHEKGRGHDRRR